MKLTRHVDVDGGLVLDLVDRIYASAMDPRRWPEFLRALATTVDGQLIAFIKVDKRRLQCALTICSGLDSVVETHCSECQSARDAWWQRQPDKARPGDVNTSAQIESDAELQRSQLCIGVVRHLGGHFGRTAAIFGSETHQVNLTILQASRGRDFTSREVNLMRALVPHLQQAMRIQYGLAAADLEFEAARIAFESLGLGLLIMSDESSIEYANPLAVDMLGSGDGLAIGARPGVAQDECAHRRVRELIRRCLTTRMGAGPNVGGTVSIGRPSGMRDWQVSVAPSRAALRAREGRGAKSLVLVVVHDPDRPIARAAEMTMASAFGLTDAEASFAALLADGRSVVDAADQLQISANTARSRLRKIYWKSGAGNLTELVQLARTLAALGEAE